MFFPNAFLLQHAPAISISPTECCHVLRIILRSLMTLLKSVLRTVYIVLNATVGVFVESIDLNKLVIKHPVSVYTSESQSTFFFRIVRPHWYNIPRDVTSGRAVNSNRKYRIQIFAFVPK